MEVLRWFAFRLTRYSDLDLGQIDQMEDLLDTVEQQVFRRRFGEVVRLEVQRDMPTALRSLLLEEINDAETQSVRPLGRPRCTRAAACSRRATSWHSPSSTSPSFATDPTSPWCRACCASPVARSST
jgi:polyphosphate kinase